MMITISLIIPLTKQSSQDYFCGQLGSQPFFESVTTLALEPFSFVPSFSSIFFLLLFTCPTTIVAQIIMSLPRILAIRTGKFFSAVSFLYSISNSNSPCAVGL